MMQSHPALTWRNVNISHLENKHGCFCGERERERQRKRDKERDREREREIEWHYCIPEHLSDNTEGTDSEKLDNYLG